jgi:hypothetical protein
MEYVMNENEQVQPLNVTPENAQPVLPPGELEKRPPTWIFIIVAVIVVGLIIAGTVFLITSDAAVTSKVRDIFIIFMALEALVIGAALVILIIQIAVLTNLIQNEVKPILDSTNETVSTLRGTVRFLSDNLSEPIIVLNEYLAAIKRMLELMRFKRK